MVYAATSLVASFIQIPLMCLYGVLTAMTVDYNEWKYGKKLVAMSGGAIGFGSKVGSGLGSVILSAFLAIGGYIRHRWKVQLLPCDIRFMDFPTIFRWL